MKISRTKEAASLAVVLLPVLVGLWWYGNLPGLIPVHYGLDGTADLVLGKNVVLFLAPGVMVLLQLAVLASFQKRPPLSSGFGAFVTWTVPVVFFTLQTSLLYQALGHHLEIRSLALIVTGFVLLIVGNYLPKEVVEGQEGVANRKLAYAVILAGFLVLLAALYLGI